MDIKKIIAILYFAYTFYIILVADATNLTFLGLLPSILLLWSTYLIFYAGYSVFNKPLRKEKSISANQEVWLYNGDKNKLLIGGLSSVVCSVLVGRFYTGQTPISMMHGIRNGVSLYAEYQKFFVTMQRGTFTFIKIPYIFMMVYINAVVFYSYCALIIKKDRLNRSQILYLGTVTISLAYIGIVRGTNFEFFQMGMIIIFVLFSKNAFAINKKNIATFIKVLIMMIVLMSIYSLTLKLRKFTAFYSISEDVFYNPNGVIPTLTPLISNFVIMLYGYFGHGFNYISVYINEVWFSSFNHFMAGLLPMGHEAIFGIKLHEIMITKLDMKVMWQPDNALMIGSFGFVGLFLIVFLLGIISKISYKTDSTLEYLIQFMILLQMVSLPVGSFILTSSTNILIFFTLLLYLFWKVLIRVKIKIYTNKV